MWQHAQGAAVRCGAASSTKTLPRRACSDFLFATLATNAPLRVGFFQPPGVAVNLVVGGTRSLRCSSSGGGSLVEATNNPVSKHRQLQRVSCTQFIVIKQETSSMATRAKHRRGGPIARRLPPVDIARKGASGARCPPVTRLLRLVKNRNPADAWNTSSNNSSTASRSVRSMA